MDGLGVELQRWRAARGLSVIGTAQRAGISRRTLQRWEADESPPNPQALQRVLDALEVPPGEQARALAEAAPRGARDALAHTPLGSPVRLGQALSALRARSRLTQAQAASRLGVNQATIARWESGAREPENESLGRALALLGATPQETVWARGLAGQDAHRFSSPHDAKAWLDENQPTPENARDVLLLAFERGVWARATRDPRWERLLAEAKAMRALAHWYTGDVASTEAATREALALADRLGAWEEAVCAIPLGIFLSLRSGAISLREAAYRDAQAVEFLPEGSAYQTCLSESILSMVLINRERARELIERLRNAEPQELRSLPQVVSMVEVWLHTARLCWVEGDPEGTLEALARARTTGPDLFIETLRTKALHLVEPGRPTEEIVQREYSAVTTNIGRDYWRGVSRDLGLPLPR